MVSINLFCASARAGSPLFRFAFGSFIDSTVQSIVCVSMLKCTLNSFVNTEIQHNQRNKRDEHEWASERARGTIEKKNKTIAKQNIFYGE